MKSKKKFSAGQGYHRPEYLKIQSPQSTLPKNTSLNTLLKSASSTKASTNFSSPKVFSFINPKLRPSTNLTLSSSPSSFLFKLNSSSNLQSPLKKFCPKFPMSSKQALLSFSEDLNKLEQIEIQEYQIIYMLGSDHRIMPSIENPNNGYDDNKGDYIIIPGDHIAYRYEILKTIGKGSFGQVVECFDNKRREKVAIKIIKNKKRFHQQAATEIKILQQLRENDLDNKYNVIKLKNYFQFRGHICICFELLSINLYELQKQNYFEGLSLTLIHRFSVQILVCLQYLSSQKIIHCDLKPENILLKDTEKALISIIDFGTSCYENEKVYNYIQSRFYRAPEIILGVEYGMAIDMWSLGCVLVELFLGKPLFAGKSELEQLLLIIRVIGPPPRELLNKASKKSLFFDSKFEIKDECGEGTELAGNLGPLRSILKGCCEDFIEFVQKCLAWMPRQRITPLEALDHPWITKGLVRKER